MSMLFVSQPFTVVVSTVLMRVCSLTLGLVTDPVAFVDVTICMDQLPMAIGLIIAPLTLIPASIWPTLFTMTISIAVKPLSGVNCSIWQVNSFFCFSLLRFLLLSCFLSLNILGWVIGLWLLFMFFRLVFFLFRFLGLLS